MNRRQTLASLFGQSTTTMQAPLEVIQSGLESYSGDWSFAQAAHLLRRSTFGVSNATIQEAVAAGLDATLMALFQSNELPEPPINYDFTEDPYVAVGETWINAAYVQNGMILGYRNRSFAAWQVKVLMEEEPSIREKMTLFWHNHFSVANVNDPKFVYKYITLLRTYSTGNFRQLIKDIIIDPAMLRFLNGNQNTVESPNENFGRELLELYTIGKGPQVGPGDYTNYTEQDVREVSRALTGWRDLGYVSPNENSEVRSFFRPVRHDRSNKTLSHRFGNTVITDAGADEYKNVVDIIFQQTEVARFISRKLYRWFVYYHIDETIEANVIEPMAQMLIDNDYNITPVLQSLLGSQHFFDALNVGPMIKNPMDFSIGLFRQNQISVPGNTLQQYPFYLTLYGFIGTMDMNYFDPPSVAGWKAYYQEPGYYRTWINSSTLRPRMLLTDVFSTVGFRARNGQQMVIDVFEIVANLSDPLDPNVLITELADLYFPVGIDEEQLVTLKEVLIPGLPDFEWTL
ncbi:MAG: DUF1800 domain-containing protein, partial [Bacteroidota bacterium]